MLSLHLSKCAAETVAVSRQKRGTQSLHIMTKCVRLEFRIQFVATIEKVDVESSHYVCSVSFSCSSGIPAVIAGLIGLAFSSQMTVQI